jgi:hypothetical protein
MENADTLQNDGSSVDVSTVVTERLLTMPTERSDHAHELEAVYDAPWAFTDTYQTLITESDAADETRNESGYLVLDEGVSLGMRYDGRMYEALKNFGPDLFLENETPGGRVGLEGGDDQNIVINRRNSSGQKINSLKIPADGSNKGETDFNIFDRLRVWNSADIGLKDSNGFTRTRWFWNPTADGWAVITAKGNNQLFLKGDSVGLQQPVNHNRNTSSNVVWESGSSRPSNPVEGQRFFDTDLGQPIWYDGTDWVDATGSTV